ncbi:MAG: ABC transporter permease [Chloroflexi bacterium]|nr:ABC transporter permease [Chloroflexota bacterium]
MKSYFFRRLLLTIPLLIFISLFSFMIMHISPGDPLAMYMNPEKRGMTPEQMEQLRHQLGLDRPVAVQYFYWLKNTLQGNWGYSLKTKAPVLQEILSRLPNTLLLGAASLLLTLLIGIPLGVLSAIKHYSFIDYLTTVISFIGISMPGFWFALLLIFIFSYHFNWLPSVGMQTIGFEMSGTEKTLDILKHMILPVLTLSIVEIGYWARYQRSTLLEVMNQDYVRLARAKGVTEKNVIWKHAFRNALLPMITLLGLTLPELVNGSYIVESIFGWPGLGRLGVNSILQRDYPIVMGVTMLSALLVVGGNILADLLYALFDPRIRQG